MANGTTHDFTCLALGVGLAVSIPAIVPAYADLAVWVGLGSACGKWFTPDLDLANATRKRWGLLSVLWQPYRAIIPCHRHWLSHAPVIGTLGRVAYALAILSPLVITISGQLDWALVPYGVAWVVGLALADIGHLALDGWDMR